MSGFAVLNGEPDGAPLLPPLALADGVTALATAFAIMAALRAREQTGRGQVVDTSLVEPLLTLLGPQLTAFDLLGELQPRTGNRSSHNAPRNLYRTADGSWVAVSSSATSIAARVMRARRTRRSRRRALVRDRLRPCRARGRDRRRRRGLDRASAPRDDVLAAFEAAGCAIAPVYDARDVLADPQLEALGSISTVDDLQLGATADAERDQPALRDARARSATRAARTAPTPPPSSPSSASRRTSSRGSAPSGVV